MSTRVERVSVRQKVEGAVEALICLASGAVVLIGTIAICFPATTLLPGA
jgi:hypothetical protein